MWPPRHVEHVFRLRVSPATSQCDYIGSLQAASHSSIRDFSSFSSLLFFRHTFLFIPSRLWSGKNSATPMELASSVFIHFLISVWQNRCVSQSLALYRTSWFTSAYGVSFHRIISLLLLTLMFRSPVRLWRTLIHALLNAFQSPVYFCLLSLISQVLP